MDRNNLTCKNFVIDCVLQWRLIIEGYGLYMDYIMGNKSIAADDLSQLPINRNQETTHESMYTIVTMS